MALIVGNVIALVASLIMVYIGFLKDKKNIILVQTIQIVLFTISNAVLGGITGMIINGVGIFRNILGYYDKLDKKNQTIFIVVITILSLIFNDIGLIGLLPLFSTIIITIFMGCKDSIKLKWSFVVSSFLWLIYDVVIKSYTSSIFDFLCIVTNVYTIYQINKKEVKD